MSARLVTRRDPKVGTARKYWMIDVNYEHPDGAFFRALESERPEALFHDIYARRLASFSGRFSLIHFGLLSRSIS
jgi:hypothetical protein